MGLIEHLVATHVRHQQRAVERAGDINEAAGPRVIADANAQRAIVAVLRQAARHRHRLLHLLQVVEIECGERQQQRMERRATARRRIEQRQLAGRMAQGGCDLLAGFLEVDLVVLVTELLLLLQHRQRQAHCRHYQKQEGRAQQQPYAIGDQAETAPVHLNGFRYRPSGSLASECSRRRRSRDRFRGTHRGWC